jgi:hypothetical protein
MVNWPDNAMLSGLLLLARLGRLKAEPHSSCSPIAKGHWIA